MIILLNIMEIPIKNNLYLAPVKGITDNTFREIYAASFKGIDAAIAPFIRSDDSNKKLMKLSPDFNRTLKTIPQILTSSPAEFIELSERLAGLGCDEINWNLGCPFSMVIKKGEGAAMLSLPDKIDEFLGSVHKKKLPGISVKMRLGFHAPDEILSVIPVLNSYPLKNIIIHARTADMMYRGRVNINAFKEALNISRHPVIYNGDITHYDDIKLLSSVSSEVSGWMLGRGLLTNPFLVEEINFNSELPSDIKLARLKKFLEELLDAYMSVLQSPAHVLDHMHGIWSYISLHFENGKKIEKRIKKTAGINHYRDEFNRIFDSEPGFRTHESLLHSLI